MSDNDQRTKPMTAQTLIELLSKHDPSLPVYIRGYEEGVEDVEGVLPVTVVRDTNLDAWYYGNHSIDKYGDEDGERTPGLHIH